MSAKVEGGERPPAPGAFLAHRFGFLAAAMAAETVDPDNGEVDCGITGKYVAHQLVVAGSKRHRFHLAREHSNSPEALYCATGWRGYYGSVVASRIDRSHRLDRPHPLDRSPAMPRASPKRHRPEPVLHLFSDVGQRPS